MSSHYNAAHLIHLFCAIGFMGVVFFELVILEGMRKPLGPESMAKLEHALINRARKIMPWVVGTLFVTGILMAYIWRARLANLGTDSFGLLLTLKIVLATSVGCHFVYALKTAIDGCMNSRKFKWLHFSVATHMVLILFLAKGMFYLNVYSG